MDNESIGDNLTDKQKMFCEEYLLDLNGYQAALRAGYSENSAMQQASRLLSYDKVQSFLAALKKERSDKLKIDQEWVLKRFIEISEKCSQAEPVMEYDPDSKSMVHATSKDGQLLYKFDSSGANKATEMIAKHVGFFEKNNEQKRLILPPTINLLPLEE